MQPPEPCLPFTPCWCELNPNNPHCKPSVPLKNNSLTLIIIFGIVFYILLYKKLKTSTDIDKSL